MLKKFETIFKNLTTKKDVFGKKMCHVILKPKILGFLFAIDVLGISVIPLAHLAWATSNSRNIPQNAPKNPKENSDTTGSKI